LSQIDTTKTIIRDFCPEYLLPRECEVERYRTLEGLCNNLKNPLFGAAMKAHSRFLPYDFEDGISAPRISVTGKELPSARLVCMMI
jgi:peroxidase